MSFARLVSVPQLLIDQYGVIGVMLGVVGFGVMVWRKDGIRLLLLLGGFVMTILFASSYHIGDIFHYYIPAYLVWAIWIGAGVAWIFETIRNSQYVLSTSLKAGFRIAIAVFFVGHVMIQLAGNLPYSDRSGETQPRDQWTRILSSSIPQNAILISNDRDEMMPMWYIQYVENVRRDLVGLFPIITPSPEHANVVRLTDSVLDVGRPIYFIKPMAGIEVKYKVEPADGLWRVSGRASDATPQFGSNTVLSDRVRVLGYDFVRDSNAARVVIYWQPLSKLDGNYASFVHLLDAKGNKVAQGNDHQVGGEFYPTSMWKIGETLRDEQLITLATNLLGNYRLLVGMYRQSDSEMLGEPVELGTINFP